MSPRRAPSAVISGLALGLCIGLGLGLGGCAPGPRYDRSPRWHDGRFHNPPAWPEMPGVQALLRWLSSRPDSYPDFTPRTLPNDGARLRAAHGRVSVTWIGHASLLVQLGGLSVLTDPVFSRSLGGIYPRYAPPGIARADLPRIDAVLISHDHRDHLDEASVKSLGPETLFVVPLGLAPWFRARGLVRVVELDWWETLPLRGPDGRTVTVTLVPAQHWSRRGLLDERKTLWGGYVLDAPKTPGRTDGARFYFAGDTGYPAAFAEIGRRCGPIDYALLPIGAYAPRWFMHAQHMAPEDTARAFVELRARVLVPMHFATFRLSDEPMAEPPRLLRRALGARATQVAELAIGETLWGGPEAPAGTSD